MAQKYIRKTLLSLSVAAALSCSAGNVFANGGDRVEELEARVAELEALVLQLLETQEAAETATMVVDEVRAAAIAEEKVNSMLAEYQAAKEAEEKKHKFTLGGYVKTDVSYSDYSAGSVPGNNLGRDFYYPNTIPVGDEDAEGQSYLDFFAKESRVNLKTEHNLDSGDKLTTFVEIDFLGSAQGNELVTNSYSPRLRHAFFTYNKWLFGQTWFTFFNVGALPENLDFIGPAESTIFGRQTQIRYTSGPWQFALENPLTTAKVAETGAAINADTSHIPDGVVRYNMKGDWGDFTVAGIIRQLRVEENGIKDTTTGWGISASGKFLIGRDDFRWMATTGKGVGRYIGVVASPGAVVDDNDNLHAISSTGVFGSYRHFWSDTWRSNLTLGYLWIDNKSEYTYAGSDPKKDFNKDSMSVHANLIYSPLPKLDLGIEFLYAKRELENDLDGNLKRVQFSAKYAY